MFNVQWLGKITKMVTSGDAGNNSVLVTLVAPADDSLFTPDTIGPAARRSYKDVKAGKLGSVDVSLLKRWLCKMQLSYVGNSGKTEMIETNRAIPEELRIVASKKEDKPPFVRLKVTVEWTDRDGELVFLAKAHRQHVMVKLEGLQQGLPMVSDDNDAPKPKPKKGNSKQAELTQ